MKQPLSIGEISQLLNVPKSTLRYWDSENLIDLTRNDVNNYREYSRHTLIALSDMVYYRSLNMPLKEMKRLKAVTPKDLKDSLIALDKNLENEIDRLLKSKAELKKRMININTYMEIVNRPYQQEAIDFKVLYSFDYQNPEAWSECISDQYENLIYYDNDTSCPQIGMTKAFSTKSRLLWKEKDKNQSYITFPLAVGYGNPTREDFLPHIDILKSMGYETGKIFGRYLFSAFDKKHCDFYKGFVEIIDKNNGI
ncbi:MerR family transcriptional regulator [Lachnotalea glycerini]|uniref:MerR family transcriptional regulator n=1 Tax=Lachnotalea glycerini TaxID=1763509 RepID=A0A318EQU2_9FIRM|nr:MerR family transcriptional regulator [Lachnotalea glycerini]PXV84891.1 MerR family transcriptional regulator [Lachnotalea glycerini]